MSENEDINKQEEIIEEYKKVEQLDDVDFEKEKEEKSKNKKVKNIIFLIGIILLLGVVGFGAYYFISRGTPETLIEDFVTNFNNQDFEKVVELVDLQGFYALRTITDEEVDDSTNIEKYYTKFDERYDAVENEEEYKEFVKQISETDKKYLKEEFEGIEITISDIGEPVLIQNTKGLYKIYVTMKFSINGETASEIKYTFYIDKVKGNYKLVGGDVTELIISCVEYYSVSTYIEPVSYDDAKSAIEEFISSFNTQDFETVIGSIDLQGFYALTTTVDSEETETDASKLEAYYSKFDARYKEASSEEDCENFVNTISMIDANSLVNIFYGIEMNITQIEDAILIENTEGLYKVTATIDTITDGESAIDDYIFYVSEKDGKYQIVGGDIPASILYMMLINQYYGGTTTE